ncbi:MAG: hypothetical protein H6736_14120 [Alphaproteobacteria bacterium]|nr:hypothetical protein [Alphaproteobacteria bacterium]MCB9692943.1 hypothetical protein [Alphaproteobacteria bacterium]
MKGRHQDWEAAKEAWTDLTYATKKSVRARGFYNLALYHERRGDLEGAMATLEASENAKRSSLADDLRAALEPRVLRERAEGG